MDVIVTPRTSLADRQKAWAQIKQICPDTAEFIKEAANLFGKPEEIIVTKKETTNGN